MGANDCGHYCPHLYTTDKLIVCKQGRHWLLLRILDRARIETEPIFLTEIETIAWVPQCQPYNLAKLDLRLATPPGLGKPAFEFLSNFF
eukprot:363136-Chlamydomonas_euryale.AAC.2